MICDAFLYCDFDFVFKEMFPYASNNDVSLVTIHSSIIEKRGRFMSLPQTANAILCAKQDSTLHDEIFSSYLDALNTFENFIETIPEQPTAQ